MANAKTADGLPTINADGTDKAPGVWDASDPAWYGKYGHASLMITGITAGIGDILNANAQANALQTQAAFQKWQAGANLSRAQKQVSQVQEQTQAELMQLGTRTNKTIGAQRTGAASQGVNVNSGSALAEQVQTGQLSAVDDLTIRNDAALKAWGIQTGAHQVAGQQEMQAMGEENQAKQSLMLGGAKAANALMEKQDEYESMRSRQL